MFNRGMNIGEIVGGRTVDGRTSQSPNEAGERSAGTEPGSAKDSKNFLSFLSRKKKQREEGAMPSPEESDYQHSDNAVKPSALGIREMRMSETKMDQHANYDLLKTTASSKPVRVFVLATFDSWNFRMCDITTTSTASDIRRTIGLNLGLNNYANTRLFATELGQFHHNEALGDEQIVSLKEAQSKTGRTLKFFVDSRGNANGAARPDTAMLTPNNMPPAVDEEAYEKLNGGRKRPFHRHQRQGRMTQRRTSPTNSRYHQKPFSIGPKWNANSESIWRSASKPTKRRVPIHRKEQAGSALLGETSTLISREIHPLRTGSTLITSIHSGNHRHHRATPQPP